MQHFPIFLDLHGRRALVVGDGETAHRKAGFLLNAGAEVITHPRFSISMLDACVIAIGADAPLEDLQSLSAAAQARGIPVNIVDNPALCSYISPAIVDRSPITIAIASGGAAPILSKLCRARIESAIPIAFGRLAELAGHFKDEARRRFPQANIRRRILETLLVGRVADLVFADHTELAREAFEKGLANARSEMLGIVSFVGAGPGAADLLTIRGQRLLGEADVIIHDPSVSAAVLNLARRDAQFIGVPDGSKPHSHTKTDVSALLVALGKEGRKIVRLHTGTLFPSDDEPQALVPVGIAFEIVPGASGESLEVSFGV